MTDVEIFCGRAGFSVEESEISSVVNCLRENMPWAFPAGMLSVAFLGDDEICRMHEEFLSDPSKTDVITFPGDDVFTAPRERGNAVAEDEDSAFAGEICVCVDQAVRVAKELGLNFEDELLLYLVHGWLHLAGLDDIEEDDRKAMRAGEALALSVLREKHLAPLKTAIAPR